MMHTHTSCFFETGRGEYKRDKNHQCIHVKLKGKTMFTKPSVNAVMIAVLKCLRVENTSVTVFRGFRYISPKTTNHWLHQS